jgi:hypothetical protein
LVESRLPRAEQLVHRTLDRVAGDDRAVPAHKNPREERISPNIDQQLLPLRRRVAARQPALVASWS